MEKGHYQFKQKNDGIFRMALAPKKFFSYNSANELSSQGRPVTQKLDRGKMWTPGLILVTEKRKSNDESEVFC